MLIVIPEIGELGIYFKFLVIPAIGELVIYLMFMLSRK